MKFTRLLMLGLAAGMMAATLGARGAVAAPTTLPAQASPAPSIQAVHDAANPSAAVDAYGKALAGGADKQSAEIVYLARMIDFALPEMADSQAQDLILRDPGNGLAWAVAAHMSARRGNMAAALGQIETAYNIAPADPFVQRTAGNIFAWYDAMGGSVDIPDVIKKPITDLRTNLQAQPAFATAYSRAMDDYTHAPATQPAQGMAVAPATQPYTEVIPADVYFPPSYPVYSPTYNYYTSPPPYWYPSYSGWCGWNSGFGMSCWPWFGSSFVFVNNNHSFHDGHFHDGHFHDHGGSFVPHDGFNHGGGFQGNGSMGGRFRGDGFRGGGRMGPPPARPPMMAPQRMSPAPMAPGPAMGGAAPRGGMGGMGGGHR